MQAARHIRRARREFYGFCLVYIRSKMKSSNWVYFEIVLISLVWSWSLNRLTHASTTTLTTNLWASFKQHRRFYNINLNQIIIFYYFDFSLNLSIFLESKNHDRNYLIKIPSWSLKHLDLLVQAKCVCCINGWASDWVHAHVETGNWKKPQT